MKNYQLLDSGDLEKLELIGGYKIIRPSLNSFYRKKNEDLWRNADAHYIKNDKGSGKWHFNKHIPESFTIQIEDNIEIKIKLTPFGHIGFFPEQNTNWKTISSIKNNNQNQSEVLNLFAYSGVSTLYLLNQNFSVCHVDASKGMVDWARENANFSGLANKPVRWIIDDVSKFIKREIRRGKKYDGFVLDPPSFGRGAKGEIWKIEDHLIPLLDDLFQLKSKNFSFCIISCHTTGFSPLVLDRILKTYIDDKIETFKNYELYIQEKSGMKLPGGFCASYIKSL
jgi:23S rRNA (cytosine1962-C5)-methyltransferase